MKSADTIAAIATAPGRAGIGIVRLSGARVPAIAAALLGRLPPPRHATLASFREAAGEPIDRGIALYFPGPRSFTGEDVLELHAHGGPVVLGLLLERAFELGARAAEPGEFALRAFLNDKMDLAQAEAVADLVAAGSAQAARAAGRARGGER
jgi:tRNA modification GTPase